MAVFKCKICNGDIKPNTDGYTGICEYCGTLQTLPKDKDEKIGQLLNRANDFRLNCDFDRAIFEYEKVLELDEKEPEAHWGIFLSRYGVEYVKDTMTFAYKPTLHRISSVSVFDDVDYQATIKYASPSVTKQYRADAEHIEMVMKELLLLSANQEPYDIFLSYKELDDVTRQRTDDSYLAHDLYNELTAQGYKVFFAPKSLVGVALYEPKIYSAIISSKVMIVLGTKPQYLESVWVKNEWSRFAEAIENGEDKVLIPVFKGMEANQLPNRIAKYQAYNMANMTFLPSLFDVIANSVKRESKVDFNKNSSAEAAFLERGLLALEDRDFRQADSFFENALNLNPHSSQAYFGKLMVEMKVCKKEQILTSSQPLNKYKNFEKAVRFADQQLKTILLQYEEKVQQTIDEQAYNKAMALINKKDASREDFENAASIFKSIIGFKDADQRLTKCRKRITEIEENIAEEEVTKKEKKKLFITVVVLVLSVSTIIFSVLYPLVIKPWYSYKQAEKALSNDDTDHAVYLLRQIGTERAYQMIEDIFIDMVEAGEYEELEDIVTNTNFYNFHREPHFNDEDSKVIASFAAKASSCGNHYFALHYLQYLDNDIGNEKLYSLAKDFESQGYDEYAAIYYGSAGNYSDSRQKSFALWDKLVVRKTFDTGEKHTVALKSDGTVYATGDNENGQCEVDDWTDIIAVSAGFYHTVGLKSDGTVVVAGLSPDTFSDWTDIINISAGGNSFMGLKSDGTIVHYGSIGLFEGSPSKFSTVNFSVGDYSAVFVKLDGSAEGWTGNLFGCGETNVDEWSDIKDVSVGYQHTVALKNDGTVIATEFNHAGEWGKEYYNQCDVGEVRNAVAVSAGKHHTVAVLSNGKAKAIGLNDCGQCDVNGFTNLVDASAGSVHTVCLTKEGKLVAAGDNSYGQCDVSGWTDIKLPRNQITETESLAVEDEEIKINETDNNHSITTCVNYSKNDIVTNLNEIDGSKNFYYHITGTDEALYNKELTLSYKTNAGYCFPEQKFILNETNDTYTLEYPVMAATSSYTVTFNIISDDGKTFFSQDVLITI